MVTCLVRVNISSYHEINAFHDMHLTRKENKHIQLLQKALKCQEHTRYIYCVRATNHKTICNSSSEGYADVVRQERGNTLIKFVYHLTG